MNALREKKWIVIVMVFILVCLSVYGIAHRKGVIHFVRERRDLMSECVPVLAYHGFVPEKVKKELFRDNKWIDDIEGFEKQMEYLHDNHWRTLTADEFYDWHEGQSDVPEKSCMITFDDGYYEMYYEVYPILKKYGFNATVFVIGTYTPEQTAPYDPHVRAKIGWDKINEVKKEYPGFQFESHSYDLHGFDEDGNEPWVTATEKMLEEDFQKMDEYGFRYMAYPYGGYNDLMLEAIGKSKIKMAFTFKEPGYATKHYPVYEIPRQKVTAETTYEEFVEMLEKVE